MTAFTDFILPIIYDYKQLLKKNLSYLQYNKITKELGIKRMQLRNSDELDLFVIAKTIIQELEKQKFKEQKKVKKYSGTDQFFEYIKNSLKNYRIEKDRVINISHESSCAIMEIIQLLSQTDDKDFDIIKEKTKHLIEKILNYGIKEKILTIKNILHKQKKENQKLIEPLLKLLNTSLES